MVPSPQAVESDADLTRLNAVQATLPAPIRTASWRYSTPPLRRCCRPTRAQRQPRWEAENRSIAPSIG